jgi:hypothetical protein
LAKRILSLASLNASRTTTEILRKNGHSVLWVIHIKEAISFLKITQFDLVVVAAEQGEPNIEAIANATASLAIPFVVIGDVPRTLHRRAHAVISPSIPEKQLLKILFEDD